MATQTGVDITNVKSFEEEVLLIQESERDYQENGWMDPREAYIKWLEYIRNLGKNVL